MEEEKQPLDESAVLVSTGVIGLPDGVLEKDTKKTVQEWRELGIDVEKFIEFNTLRPFVASDLTNGEAESIVQTIQRLTQENESLKAENEALKAEVNTKPEGAPALPSDARERLLKVSGVGDKLVDPILDALTAPA